MKRVGLILAVFMFSILLGFAVQCAYAQVVLTKQTSGTTRSLRSVSFSNSEDGLACGDSGAVLTTNDAGRSWEPVSTTAKSNFSEVFTFGYKSNFLRSGNLFWRSTDGCNTWNSSDIGGGISSTTMANETVGYAVGANRRDLPKGQFYYESVFQKTVDGGRSFVRVADGWRTIVRSVSCDKDSTVLAIANGAATLRSLDGGTSWSTVTIPDNENWKDDGAKIWMISSSDGVAVTTAGIVLQTKSGGRFWKKVFTAIGEQWDICFLDADIGIIVGSSNKVLRTTDGGDTWNAVKITSPGSVRSASILNSKEFVMCGDSGGIFRSIDSGVSFSRAKTGTSIPFTDIKGLGNKSAIAVGGSNNFFKTTDSGNSWFIVPSGAIGAFVAVDFSDSLNGFAVGNKDIVRTSDGGNTWSKVGETSSEAFDIGFSSSGIATIIGEKFILTSVDTGKSFQPYPTGLFGNNYYFYYSLNFRDSLNGIMAGDQGLIMATNDGGRSWNRIDAQGSTLFSSTIISSRIGLMVGAGGVICKSNDSMQTWTWEASPTINNLRCVAFVDTLHGVAGGENGTILTTINGGKTWSTVDTPPYINFYGACKRGKNNVELVGSLGTIVNLRFDDINSIANGDSLPPRSITIHPNPASSSITIQLPDYSRPISIQFFNMLGEQVKEFKEMRTELTIPIEDLPHGVYAIRANDTVGRFVIE